MKRGTSVMYQFKGFVKNDYKYEHETLPENAELLQEEGLSFKGCIAGFAGIAAGYGILLLKQYSFNGGRSVLNKPFIIAGIILGALLLLLHEVLHLIPYPKQSRKIIIIKSLTPSAYCSAAVSKTAFVVSSLLPVLLGIIPLAVFLLLPSEYSAVNTVLWTIGTIGLASPANDYIEAAICFINAPAKSMIQAGEEGFFYYMP